MVKDASSRRLLERMGSVEPARWLFIAVVVAAGLGPWIVRRPPMGDLGQHAGQIALLHDLLAGNSRWADLVHVNAFTPYLLGYGAATLLSFVVPVFAALKIMLTAAYYAHVTACVALRREFGGDERLDWLFVPGFFGFAYHFGFYTFLVATPLGLSFILLAKRYADEPTRARGAVLAVLGLVTFFAHGLVFAFAAVVGVGFVLVSSRESVTAALGRAARSLAPYAFLFVLAVAYALRARAADPLLAEGPALVDWEWDKSWGWHRVPNFALYALASRPRDVGFFLPVLVFAAAPWALGARFSSAPKAWVMLALCVSLWFVLPGEAVKTNFLYHRFAVFLLPAYALAFRRAEVSRRATWVTPALALAAIGCVVTLAVRARRFAAESAGFEEVLAAAEPGERALSIVVAPASDAARVDFAYHAYPHWYQAERGGFVDFNFAYLLPQIVRFRPEQRTAMREDVVAFDWEAVRGRRYRYFFVRTAVSVPADFVDNGECRLTLVTRSGDWSLYERGECR